MPADSASWAREMVTSMSDEAPPTPNNEGIVDAVRQMVGLRPMPSEETLPLVKRIACAIIALGAHERQVGGPVLVVLPRPECPLAPGEEDKRRGRIPGLGTTTTEMLGELLIEAGESLVANEPRATYDPTLEAPRDRFLDAVRDAAKELQASVPHKPRLVTPAGRPLR
jgi:hypothetical protein